MIVSIGAASQQDSSGRPLSTASLYPNQNTTLKVLGLGNLKRNFCEDFSLCHFCFRYLCFSNHGFIGDDVKELPLFDAHIHYKEPAWSVYPPEAVVKLMDDAGV